MATTATLQVSFYGPFFFDFTRTPTNTVNIYAPRCPGHKAGIFSAKNEQPLHGRHKHGGGLIYVLDGSVFLDPNPNGPPLKTVVHQDAIILDVSSYASPVLNEAFFSLQVPYPQYVYGINGSPSLEVVQGGKPQGVLNHYATGLRFYYQADLTGVITLSNPGCDPFFSSDFDPIPLTGPELLRNSDVIVRYDSGTPEDSEHEDATSCFDQIAALAGINWWLCYEDPQSPLDSASFVRTGDDCAAPIMLVQS